MNAPCQDFKGYCVGGPDDGYWVECERDWYHAVTKQHPDEQLPGGTWTRVVEYESYHWDAGTMTWRCLSG